MSKIGAGHFSSFFDELGNLSEFWRSADKTLIAAKPINFETSYLRRNPNKVFNEWKQSKLTLYGA
jgi:hypothetical protein